MKTLFPDVNIVQSHCTVVLYLRPYKKLKLMMISPKGEGGLKIAHRCFVREKTKNDNVLFIF